MPFLMYRDNDSGLRPSSYPYILGRALNEYRINTSVPIYSMGYRPSYVIIVSLKLYSYSSKLPQVLHVHLWGKDHLM